VERGGRPERLVRVSKAMSAVLRHRASKLGLAVRPDGFVRVEDLMRLEGMRHFALSADEIVRVVETCPKHRFSLCCTEDLGREDDASGEEGREEGKHGSDPSSVDVEFVTEGARAAVARAAVGELWVRANQGHTMRGLEDEKMMTRLTEADCPPTLLHVTSATAVDSIRAHGLKRMARRHVHMVDSLDSAVARTARSKVVVIDAHRAMADGIVFYRSDNGVFLTPGVGDEGVLPPVYISAIRDRRRS
jgi:2'-phosphotransferase